MSRKRKSLESGAIIALIAIILVALITLVVFLFSKQKIHPFDPDFGSLIGGSLGGIGTLLAVIFSIKYGHAQADTMRHDSIRPLLEIWHLSAADKGTTFMESNLYDWVYNFRDSKIEKKNLFLENMEENQQNKTFSRIIAIKNIGLGTAINIELSIRRDDIKLNTDQFFHLEKGAKTLRRLIIPNMLNPHLIAGTYSFHFTYKDMLGKDYSQDVPIELSESATEKCGIDLASYINTSIDGLEEM